VATFEKVFEERRFAAGLICRCGRVARVFGAEAGHDNDITGLAMPGARIFVRQIVYCALSFVIC
jgi:hypothetical protein